MIKPVVHKATVESRNAYRCLDCREVIKTKSNCPFCFSSNIKEIKIHTIKPKGIVVDTKNKQKKKMEAK